MNDKEGLMKSIQQYDFFSEDFLKEVERVDIFCENCAECPSLKNCPSYRTLGRVGYLLKRIHEDFCENDVDSRLHELTSDDNPELDKIVSDAGCVLPLHSFFTEDGIASLPAHNFILFRMLDGRKLLYDVALTKERKQDSLEMMYV